MTTRDPRGDLGRHKAQAGCDSAHEDRRRPTASRPGGQGIQALARMEERCNSRQGRGSGVFENLPPVMAPRMASAITTSGLTGPVATQALAMTRRGSPGAKGIGMPSSSSTIRPQMTVRSA